MSTETIAPSPVEEAKAILREVTEAQWPTSREAMRTIGNARYYLAAQADTYDALVSDEMGWADLDPDLEFFAGDPQQEAIAIAAGDVLEAAKALRNALRHAWDVDRAAARKTAVLVSGTKGGKQ